jgi:hypothetical protein
MMSSNPIEDELDAIRIRLYEQTKDMTPSGERASERLEAIFCRFRRAVF